MFNNKTIEIKYRNEDGALLRNCPLLYQKDATEAPIPASACFEIGDWPFFNSYTKKWETKKNQSVTPSYHVTMMFDNRLDYTCNALLLPSHVDGNLTHINLVSDFFRGTQNKIEIENSNINTSMYLYQEIVSLNSFLSTSIYGQPKIPLNTLLSSDGLEIIKVNARIIFSALRQILLNVLCSFFEKEKVIKNPLIEDDFIGFIGKQEVSEKYPVIERYNHLFRLITDVDNCLKHEVLERRTKNEMTSKPGIKVVKLNFYNHYKNWNIPKKNLDIIDYSRKQFWTYAIEYDALITEFSRFLCDFLDIKDTETERRPPIFFQIQEKWSLSNTLPIDPKSQKKK